MGLGKNGAKLRDLWRIVAPKEGLYVLSPEFQPISAKINVSRSMDEWLLSRRDRLIVARHGVPG
jgi:hypothetical protein